MNNLKTVGLVLALFSLAGCGQQAVPAVARTLDQLLIESPGVEFPTRTALQLKAWGLSSDGTRVDLSAQVKWTSVDPSVARVGASGIAQLDGVGLARFEARFEDRLAAVEVRVTAAELMSLTVRSAEAGPLARGDVRHYSARAQYSDGTSLDVTEHTTWIADGVAVETSEIAGRVIGREEGHGVLRASYFSQQRSVALEVVAPRFLGLVLEATPVPVRPGDTHRLVLDTTWSDGTRHDVSAAAAWSSSNPEVADVSVDGVVRGVVFARSAGRATITARWSDSIAAVELVVDPLRVIGLGVETLGLQLAQGRTAGVDVIAELEDGSRVVVSGSARWASSQPAVADVSNVEGQRGLVTTHGQGIATISAWYGGLEATYDVQVTAPELIGLSATVGGGRLAVGQVADFIVSGTFTDGLTLNLSSVVSVGHGPTVVSGLGSDRVTVTGAQLGAAPVELELGSFSQLLSFEVSDAVITELAISDVSRRTWPAASPDMQGPFRFRAVATYSDGVELDVTELGHWWLDDAAVAGLSDFPGSRGVYALDLGGLTAVRVAIAGQNVQQPWNFAANP